MSEELPNEFHILDKATWKEVKQRQGAGKGQNPVVLDSGYIYAGKDNKGKEARVFVRETGVEMNLGVEYVISYARTLLSEYGVILDKWEMTSGGSSFRGHVYFDVGDGVERIPKKVIDELNEFAGRFGRIGNVCGYTIEFKDISSD